MSNLSPINITDQVRSYQQQRYGQANTIPMPQLQKIVAALLTDERGIGGLTFSIGNTAVPAQQLPAFLAANNFKPQQIGNVIYSLHRDIRETGRLTPGSDNMIHVSTDQISEKADNEAVQENMYYQSMGIQRAKSMDPLFAKQNSGAAASAGANISSSPYGLNNNPNPLEVSTISQETKTENSGNIVHQPQRLLSLVLGAYLPKPEIDAACKILFPGPEGVNA